MTYEHVLKHKAEQKIVKAKERAREKAIGTAMRAIIPPESPKWNEVTRLSILSNIRKGMNISSAVTLSGMAYRTFSLWGERAREEMEVYEKAMEKGLEIPLGEFAYFMLRCEMEKVNFAMNFKITVHNLYLEDTRFGPMLLRLMEAEFPDYYSHKIQTQVDQKTETKITYVIEQKTGDAWANRRLEDGQLSQEQNDDVEAILEATYADTE